MNTGEDTSEADNPLVIETESAQTAKSTIVEIEPIQDLHGYDHPWPAGGGKNLLEVTSSGSQTVDGVTYTINNDGSVTCSGTVTGTHAFYIHRTNILLPEGTYIMTGGSGVSYSGVRVVAAIVGESATRWIDVATENGIQFTINEGEKLDAVYLRGQTSGTVVNTTVYPMIRLASESDATFAPYSNICPISGLDEVKVKRTGFNQWDEEWELGTYDGITGAKVNDSTKIRSKNYIPAIPETNYYFFEDANPAYHNLYFYDADKNFLSVNTRDVTSFTTPSNAYYITFTLHSTYGTTYNHDICINISDPAKNGTYEPYQKFDAEVDLPTTIYGGTLNLETGELVCDYGTVDLGTLSWQAISGAQGFFSIIIGEVKNTPNHTVSNAVCTLYKTEKGNDINTTDKAIAVGMNNNHMIIVHDSAYTDAATFKTAMSGVQLAYELATPIIYHLTPRQLSLLKGTNVITVNGKTIQVTYREGSLATLEEVTEVSDALVNEEYTSEESNPVTIETDAVQYAKATHLTFAPVQDLHGYDHPWPAGGGKNLLPMTVEGIKALNTNGTWNGNVYTVNGLIFTINTDDGNVSGINVNGTSTGLVTFSVGTFNFNDSAGYYMNGCPATGSNDSFRMQLNGGDYAEYGNTSGVSIPQLNAERQVMIRFANNCTISNKIFKPMIRLASESDATFAPYSNICPITGVDEVEVRATGTGKNLLNPDRIIQGNPSNPTATNRCSTRGDRSIFVDVGEKITVSRHRTSIRYAIGIVDGNGNTLYDSGWTTGDSLSITTSYSGYLIFLGFSYTDNSTILPSDVKQANFQLELGSTATDYEPYKGYTASLDLPEPIYSGTLDLETGEVVADMGIVDLGTLNWFMDSERFVSNGLAEIVKPPSTNGIIANIICSNYASGRVYQQEENKIGISATGLIYVKDSAYTDVASFKTAMSGVQLCYELATPKTYQLTPQQLALFKGINNISTNAKTVQVTYRNGELATTGDIVESTEVAKRSILGEAASDTDVKLATSLAPILGNLATAETSPTIASHAVGEYLLYNNRLYKVLAAISAGQQLTIGTNVGQTNVAAELASQASAISVLNSKLTLSRSSKNTDYGIIWIETIGRIVLLYFDGRATSSFQDSQVIATGLPVPNTTHNIGVLVNASGGGVRVKVDNNGQLVVTDTQTYILDYFKMMMVYTSAS